MAGPLRDAGTAILTDLDRIVQEGTAALHAPMPAIDGYQAAVQAVKDAAEVDKQNITGTAEHEAVREAARTKNLEALRAAFGRAKDPRSLRLALYKKGIHPDDQEGTFGHMFSYLFYESSQDHLSNG